jgi:ABC-2 type transport system permease protein
LKKSLIIARWEYLERIKTRSFIISIFLTPIFIYLFTYLPGQLAKEEKDSIKVIGILDSTNNFTKPFLKKIEKFKLSDGQPRYLVINLNKTKYLFRELKINSKKELLNGKLDGFLLFTHSNKDSFTVEYFSLSSTNIRELNRFETIINDIRRELEFEKLGLDKSIMKVFLSEINIKSIEVDKSGKESKTDFFNKFIASLIFMVLMMITILGSGGMLIRSLVEEKSNRLIEILVSSCNPFDLLLGKIIGLSLLVFTQLLIWIFITITLLGAPIILLTSLENLMLILLYFLLGFIFYTSIFVGLGSIVTTEQEAQQMTGYLSMIIMLPIAIIIPVMQNPNIELVSILTYIPFTMPAVMMLKISSNQFQLVEFIITILIIIVSTIISIFISSKIFKIGILSYGKRPTLKELINWIKLS